MDTQQIKRLPSLIMAGALLCAFAVGLYAIGTVAFWVSHLPLFHSAAPGVVSDALLRVSGLPLLVGITLCAVDLFVLLPKKRASHKVLYEPLPNQEVTVVLTAYNDELSIGHSVKDFLAHPKVKRVIVVDNNSRDATSAVAKEAGAIVVRETRPGYGWCVFRSLCEAGSYEDTHLVLLCEGDMTFRAFDIEKFLAYSAHADVVNGTRIVEQLREQRTQLSTFMYYGNFAVGKLLEMKHLGKGTFTDVGTTYKLIRTAALQRILPTLNPEVNLEFNAHFLDTVLGNCVSMVECPITFHARVGESKGGNIDNRRATKVGLAMIKGIVTGWPINKSPVHPYFDFVAKSAAGLVANDDAPVKSASNA